MLAPSGVRIALFGLLSIGVIMQLFFRTDRTRCLEVVSDTTVADAVSQLEARSGARWPAVSP